ncbi:MAG: ParB N-terminal domain-containing protein [Clostridiales bacterium]|nr:ParB N-terminal domain-containing protein [Clostridiales bacterium]
MSKLKIEYMNIDKLIPYINNPRINDNAVDKVAASIKEFGFKNPIIVDKENVIIAGHTRLLASRKLDLKEVPTIKVEDLTETQIKAFRIADNKTSEFAEWDIELLNIELEEIDFDMEKFGFIENNYSDIDLDDFFEESEEGTVSEEKEIQCPHCKMYFKK